MRNHVPAVTIFPVIIKVQAAVILRDGREQAVHLVQRHIRIRVHRRLELIHHGPGDNGVQQVRHRFHLDGAPHVPEHLVRVMHQQHLQPLGVNFADVHISIPEHAGRRIPENGCKMTELVENAKVIVVIPLQRQEDKAIPVIRQVGGKASAAVLSLLRPLHVIQAVPAHV